MLRTCTKSLVAIRGVSQREHAEPDIFQHRVLVAKIVGRLSQPSAEPNCIGRGTSVRECRYNNRKYRVCIGVRESLLGIAIFNVGHVGDMDSGCGGGSPEFFGKGRGRPSVGPVQDLQSRINFSVFLAATSCRFTFATIYHTLTILQFFNNPVHIFLSLPLLGLSLE